MTVSIITHTYNSAALIRDTLDAIIVKTYEDWELLFTDDTSADETCKIVEEYMKTDPRINLCLLNKNSGAAVALNNSIKHTTFIIIPCRNEEAYIENSTYKIIPEMQAYR
jgi:teichuronic acid biosynthesis glycosyltransferase TuaG